MDLLDFILSWSALTQECIIIHIDGIIKFANEQSSKLTNYSRTEIIGNNIINVVFPADINIAQKRLNKILQKDEILPALEIRIIDKDENIHILEILSKQVEYNDVSSVIIVAKKIENNNYHDQEIIIKKIISELLPYRQGQLLKLLLDQKPLSYIA